LVVEAAQLQTVEVGQVLILCSPVLLQLVVLVVVVERLARPQGEVEDLAAAAPK